MKKNSATLTLILTLLLSASTVFAQTTTFTYQGKLTDGGSAASGQYDLVFRLFTAVSGGTQVGSDFAVDDVQVTGGIFTVNLNFGSVPFTSTEGNALEISIRPGASTGAFTALSPLQPLTSSPYSVKTFTATFADNLSSVCDQCVRDSHIFEVSGAKINGEVASAVNAGTAGNVTGVVQIANGGTGSTTKNFVDLSSDQSRIGGSKEFIGDISVASSARFLGDGSGLTNLVIGDGSVTTPKLADGSVTTAKIADGSVTPEKLSSSGQPNSSNLMLLGSRRWDLLSQRTSVTGVTPGGVAFDGANIWTANQGGNSATKVRISDGAVVGTFPVGVNGAIAITFDGANIWVVGGDGNAGTIVKLRASDGANLGNFTASTFLRSAVFDGSCIWVSGFGGNTTKIRVSDGANLGIFVSGSFSKANAFDGSNIWILNSSPDVTRLRASDGASAGSYSIGAGNHSIAYDGANMWVSFPSDGPSGTGAVKKIRALDGAILGTFPVPDNPTEIVFDGTHIWVASATGNYITKLRASDGVELGRFATTGTPNGLAFDGENIWVTDSSSNTVLKVPVFRER